MLTVILAPDSLGHIANIVKGYAIAIGIAIAIGFVWLWWSHRMRERGQELALRANAVWGNWLRSAVAHPELAAPGPGLMTRPGDAVRYAIFVDSLLVAAEEVLLLADQPRWRDIILRQLEPHRGYLATDDFRTTRLQTCSPAIRELMKPLTGVA
jgi:hypothetical protein